MILSHKLNCLECKKTNIDYIVIGVEEPFSRPLSGQTTFEHHGLDRLSIAERIISQMKKRNNKL